MVARYGWNSPANTRRSSSEGKLSNSSKDIIVYLDASSYAEDKLEVAAALAQQHGAKLTGVDISTDAAFEGRWRDRAAEIGDRFEAVARARGVPSRYRAAARGIGEQFVCAFRGFVCRDATAC